MAFRCSLERPTGPQRKSIDLQWPPSDLDYESLVMDACAHLEETDCRFHVQGFGLDDWRLDIGYDLAVFMEQLPDLVAGIRSHANVELNLYSQGIERLLDFRPTGDVVEIHCFSGTDWRPDPSIETSSYRELDLMLSRLALDFAESLQVIGLPIDQISRSARSPIFTTRLRSR